MKLLVKPIDTDDLSDSELHEQLEKRKEDINAGLSKEAREVFANM